MFTTPDFGSYGKIDRLGQYVTYIMMMTVYTAINVPYGAMLGVMTDDSDTKTVFSSYRMFFAYGGSFIALFAWEPLCAWFRGDDWLSDCQLAIFHDCDCCIVLCCVFALLQHDEGIRKECLYCFYREGLPVVVVQCSLVVADRCGICVLTCLIRCVVLRLLISLKII